MQRTLPAVVDRNSFQRCFSICRDEMRETTIPIVDMEYMELYYYYEVFDRAKMACILKQACLTIKDPVSNFQLSC